MSGSQYRVPPQLREAVARLMRESDLTMQAIAVTTGLSLGTLCKWNRAEGWRPVRQRRRDWDASLPRLAALHRLARPRPGPKPASGGVVSAGTEHGTEPGATARAATGPAFLDHPATDDAPADLPTLRAALRAHVGRQIAAFDAALRGEGAAVLDSARVLRDLGGLKRLLDDLADDLADDRGDDRGDDLGGEGGDVGSRLDLDLPALRAGIAGRYARLLAERPDAGPAGGPAGGGPAGVVP